MAPTATVETDLIDVETADAVDDTLQDGVLEDLLVEEVSIDGMCGVY
jgi:mycofactocin precursor